GSDAGEPGTLGSVFVVSLCDEREVNVTRAPRVGKMTRIALFGAREAVQVAFGVRPGLVDTAQGVLAVVETRGKIVRAVAFLDVGGSEDLSNTPGPGPYDLPRLTRGHFGTREVLLVDDPDIPWGEQFESGASVTVFALHEATIVNAGRMNLSRRSNGVFWRG